MTPRDTRNPLRLLWLAAALLTIVAACTPLGGWLDGNVRVFGTRSVRVAVQVAQAGFGTKAAARTAADIGFYRFKLVDVGLATIAAQYQTTATAFTFSTVPNGTYQLRAEAFSAGGVSITAGGEQTSANTATVASPAVTYSSGSSLALTLPLLAGTGEMLYNGVIVTNGAPPGALIGASLSATATVAGVFPVPAGPFGIAADAAGNVWVACNTANQVIKLNPAGATVAGFPINVAGGPLHVAIDSLSNAWVTRNSGDMLEKFDSAGVSQGAVSTGIGSSPFGLAVDPNGNVWVANGATNNVKKVSPALGILASPAMGVLPQAIAFDRYGNPLVLHGSTTGVKKLDPGSGLVLATFPVTGGKNIAVDAINQYWVATTTGTQRFSAGGTQTGSFATGSSPYGLLIDHVGRIWVADGVDDSVTVLAASGNVLATIPVGSQPRHLAVDQQGFVWVTCQGTNTVYKLKL